MGLVFVWKCAISPRLKCVAAWILMQWSVLSISMLPSHSRKSLLDALKPLQKYPKFPRSIDVYFTLSIQWPHPDWTGLDIHTTHYGKFFTTFLNSWKPQGTKQFANIWNLAQCRLWTDFKLTPGTPWSFRKIWVTLKAENSSENNNVFMSLCY